MRSVKKLFEVRTAPGTFERSARNCGHMHSDVSLSQIGQKRTGQEKQRSHARYYQQAHRSRDQQAWGALDPKEQRLISPFQPANKGRFLRRKVSPSKQNQAESRR